MTQKHNDEFKFDAFAVAAMLEGGDLTALVAQIEATTMAQEALATANAAPAAAKKEADAKAKAENEDGIRAEIAKDAKANAA